jgi:IS5 family transposase
LDAAGAVVLRRRMRRDGVVAFVSGLDRVLFEIVTPRPEAQGVMVGAGTPVDATLIRSASIRADGGSTHAPNRWAGHRRRRPVHGCEAHVSTDESGALWR